MTTNNNNFQTNNHPQAQENLLAHGTNEANQSINSMDMLKRDRFELLSAYLDGEVTAAERRQVEDWLAHDSQIQQLYVRLLKLRQGLQTIPMRSTSQSVEQTIEQVYQRMHRRSRHQAIVWGGGAIAAVFIGAVSLVTPTWQGLQVARSPESTKVPIEPLMVVLNDPVVEIPKPGIAAPGESSQLEFLQQQKDFN